MTTTDPEISVVVPVYRNAPTLHELGRRLHAVLAALGRPYEIIFVNDASPDESLDRLTELAAEDTVVVISNPVNLGQHGSMLVGLRRARGKAVVTLDADLQDPPEAIPLLLDRLSDGFSLVYAARRGQFQPFLRRVTSRLFKTSMRVIAGVPADMGPCGAMDRRMVDHLRSHTTGHPFLPAMLVGAGLPIASVPVVRSPRPVGRSAYSGWDRAKMAAAVLSGALSSRWRAAPLDRPRR